MESNLFYMNYRSNAVLCTIYTLFVRRYLFFYVQYLRQEALRAQVPQYSIQNSALGQNLIVYIHIHNSGPLFSALLHPTCLINDLSAFHVFVMYSSSTFHQLQRPITSPIYIYIQVSSITTVECSESMFTFRLVFFWQL